jgi:hypothetical protein
VLAICSVAIVGEARESVVVETMLITPLPELVILLFSSVAGDNSNHLGGFGGCGDGFVGLAHCWEGFEEDLGPTPVGIGNRGDCVLASIVKCEGGVMLLGGVSPVPSANRV